MGNKLDPALANLRAVVSSQNSPDKSQVMGNIEKEANPTSPRVAAAKNGPGPIVQSNRSNGPAISPLASVQVGGLNRNVNPQQFRSYAGNRPTE
jgi:hypothetical protein